MIKYIVMFLLLVAPAILSKPPVVSEVTEDILCMAFVVDSEARGESLEGKRAIIDVVLKRMETRKMTACEVIKEKFQFSGYKQGKELKLYENVSLESLTKLHELCKMEPVVKNSEYFHATYVNPSWKSKMQRMMQIGKHIFYKTKEK